MMEGENVLSREYSEAKTLILLEHEEQVRDCLPWLDEIEGGKQIIALTPFAMYELDKHKVPYRLPEDYYDLQELYQMGVENFQTIEGFCRIIDRSTQRAYPLITELGLKPALFSFYHLKYIYDTLTNRVFQLSKVLNAEKPNVVLIHETKRYQFGACKTAPYLLFDNRESVYAHLLALDGWNTEVKVLSPVTQAADSYFEKVSYEGFSDRMKRRTLTWVKMHPSLFDILLTIRQKGWHGSLDCLKGLLNKNTHSPVLLLGGAYNWNSCREEMQLQGIGPIYRVADDLRWLGKGSNAELGNIPSVWNELRNNEEFHRFFVQRGIDFYSIIEERLRFLVEWVTPTCLTAYQEATKLIRRRRVKALVSSTLATCVGHSVAQAAHNIGIPVVTWQHGAYGTAKYPLVEHTDLMSADDHFVFGGGVVEHYAESARRLSTRLVPVGSASLGELQRDFSASKPSFEKPNTEVKTVLYVTSNYYQTNTFISIYPPSSDNLLWRTQRAIVDILGKHGKYSVVVKLHPSLLYREPPLRAYAGSRAFHNISFVRREHSFTELLVMADIIVCDWPSTTLLQALTTSKPVLVYLGHQHMDEQPYLLLKRRALCRSDLESFTNLLDEYLSSGNTNAVDLTDNKFLERYGIMSSEGSAGNRAAKALRQILERWEVKSNDLSRDRGIGGKD
jgi:hypothetical protein